MNNTNEGLDKATFGAGCFWCVEAIYEQVNGVVSVESGYMGGHVDSPTYEEVCKGTTGHAEVCQLTYDSKVISFDELLEIFWQTHDPTTLNRQGADVGTQYRSVIFYHSEFQKERSEYYKQKLTDSKVYKDPIVTEISPLNKFYSAEGYHQGYFGENGSQPYCSMVIKPKVDKFKKVFKNYMKQ